MLRDIILEQKLEYEKRKGEHYVQRQFASLNLNSGLIQVIIGPRRSGKSFFGMHQQTNDRSFGYVNFDDERLIAIQEFDELLRAVIAVYGNPEVLLLDEIQNLPKWEIIVNRLQRQGYQLVVTGSNSRLLSRELATHLTGRHQPVYLF
ncbi:MAG: AAA family ATPase, partial [Bacteroidales bacterium]